MKALVLTVLAFATLSNAAVFSQSTEANRIVSSMNQLVGGLQVLGSFLSGGSSSNGPRNFVSMEENSCEPDPQEIVDLTTSKGSYVCTAFLVKFVSSPLNAAILDADFSNATISQVNGLLELICVEADCINAIAALYTEAAASEQCLLNPSQLDSVDNYAQVLTNMCTRKGSSGPFCAETIMNLVNDTHECVAGIDGSSNADTKMDAACCAYISLGCCYTSLNREFSLDDLLSTIGDNPFNDTQISRGCPQTYSGCVNPFNPNEYVTSTFSLVKFSADGEYALTRDLSAFWGVAQNLISLNYTATSARRRRDGFLTQATAVPTNLQVSILVPDGTDPAALITSLEASGNPSYQNLGNTSLAIPGFPTSGNIAFTSFQVQSNQPEPFVPVPYSPSGPVKQLHGWPRVVGTVEIVLSTGDEQLEYLKGLGSVIGPFLAIGIILFLCCPFYHCARNSKCETSCQGTVWKIIYFILLGIVVVGCFLCFLSSGEVGSATTTVSTAFQSTGKLFEAGAEDITEGLASIATIEAQFATLRTECAGNDDALSAIDALDQALVSINASLEDADGSLAPFSVQLYDLSDVLSDNEPLREKTTYASLAFVILTFLIGGIHVGLTCKAGGGVKILYWVTLLLGMFVMLGAWSTGGVNALVGVLISDICMDPVRIITTLQPPVNCTEPGCFDFQEEVRNIFWCNGTSNIFGPLAAAEGLVSMLGFNVDLINENDCNTNSAAFQSSIATVDGAAANLTDTLNNIFTLVSCPTVSAPITTIVYSAMCTDIPSGAQLYLGGACMIGIFGMLMLCILPKMDNGDLASK